MAHGNRCCTRNSQIHSLLSRRDIRYIDQRQCRYTQHKLDDSIHKLHRQMRSCLPSNQHTSWRLTPRYMSCRSHHRGYRILRRERSLGGSLNTRSRHGRYNQRRIRGTRSSPKSSRVLPTILAYMCSHHSHATRLERSVRSRRR